MTINNTRFILNIHLLGGTYCRIKTTENPLPLTIENVREQIQDLASTFTHYYVNNIIRLFSKLSSGLTQISVWNKFDAFGSKIHFDSSQHVSHIIKCLLHTSLSRGLK